MRLLHTSDWHLGQSLHDVSREHEHAVFLSWLLDTLESEAVDALLVTGDIFDSANPPPHAQRAYYDFLAACRVRLPQLDIVILGGNHDSAARLDAPARVLRALRTTVLGALPRCADHSIDAARALVPLHDRDGGIAAWVVGVPFLRPVDLPTVAASDRGETQLVAGVRRVYAELLAAARARREPGQALIGTGHCFMIGGGTSDRSERKIQVGNAEALPADIFADDLAYVALGHLHRAQVVSGQAHVRYAGSPLPLSLGERDYQHGVVLVDLEGGRLSALRELRVPRTVDILLLPERHLPLPEVLPLLQALPRQGPEGACDAERPYLEVRVLLDAPYPRLRQEVEAALAGAWARLLRIDPLRTGSLDHPEPVPHERHLRELEPEEIFRRCYHRRFDDDAPPELVRLFQSLLETVQQGGAA